MWVRRLTPLMAALVVLGGVVCAVVLARSETVHARGAWVVLALTIGWGFGFAGLSTWYRQPDRPLGPLMLLTGAFALTSGLTGSSDDGWFDLGWVASGLMLALLAQTLITFPSGRPRGRFQRGLVLVPYLLIVPAVWVQLPEVGPQSFPCEWCPRVAPLLETGNETIDVQGRIQGIAGALVAITIAVMLLRRRAASDERMRHAITPVLRSGALLAGLLSIGFAGAAADSVVGDVAIGASYVVVAGTPYAFVVGLARSRLDVAAALQTENRRLEDELRARLVELERSRARLVAAGDETRRKIERDLHDGAQQRFVALALTLRLARTRVAADTPLARHLDAAIEELTRGLEELRELARGIHPAVLTDRGIGPAVESLLGHVDVAVDVAEMPDGRFPRPVEAAAYFLVAEALENAARHASATHARVRVAADDGVLRVEVVDDGAGGADPAAGAGLRGVADRVAAVDGRLVVESPPGAGTRIAAELPL